MKSTNLLHIFILNKVNNFLVSLVNGVGLNGCDIDLCSGFGVVSHSLAYDGDWYLLAGSDACP